MKICLVFTFILTLVEAQNMTRLKFQCEKWDREQPYENGVLDNCSMTVKKQDLNEFIFHLKSSEYEWVLFRFYLLFDCKEVFKTICVVEPHLWTWTFPAPHGAYQYLKWPKEYGVWSFGLLDLYSYGPMNLTIQVNGNCPVIIGQNETTQRIGVALLEMAKKAANQTDIHKDYQFGSACYIERVYVESDFLYHLCKHIICPLETTGYKCCTSRNETNIVCDGKPILFDAIWWATPFIIGLIMFAYSPLVLIKLFHRPANSMTEKDYDHYISMHADIQTSDWLICNPLTFWSVIKNRFALDNTYMRILGHFVQRTSIVFLTLSVVFVQVCIHYFYDYHYTLQLYKHGAPLAFRSMATGYENSKHNFMPLIGGPYVGLGIYLATTLLLVNIPRCLESFINRGIPNNLKLSTSPLTIDLKTKGTLGAVYDIERQYGYQKMYNLMKAHIYMLINPSFWCTVLQMQVRRYIGWLNTLTLRKPLIAVIVLSLTGPYVFVVCVFELTLAVVYYGFPVFLFMQIILVSYCAGIKNLFKEMGEIWKIAQYFCIVVTVGILIFNMYILTIVFVDSFHFITRMIIFTFTGFIAYPSNTYGYTVFLITVVLYVTETIQYIRKTYSKLFHYIIRSCRIIKKRNMFKHVQISKTDNDVFMISRELFVYVVSRYKPIRVQILFSILRLAIVTFILFLASHTIVTLQRMWDLNPLTQVTTALFVCLVPKIWRMFLNKDMQLVHMRENLTVLNYCLVYCRQKLYTKRYELDIIGKNEKEAVDEKNDIDVNE